MCLYPKIILNRKYTANKKNGGIIPECKDERTKYVPIGCTKCMECRKQKARQWQVRLQEEIRVTKHGQFVTLTISTKELLKLNTEITGITGYERENEIITLAVRRFLERWRKEYGTSVKHWLVTELGHGTTEHIHVHGIIWTDKKEEINRIWKYGYTWIGSYVNERTVNYIQKYVSKQDLAHKEYRPKILTSAGIGGNYINRVDAGLNKYKINGETKETYTTRQGIKINLPIYYRNKIYTEEQRELLWIEKLDKQERWVNGIKIDISKGDERYYKVLTEAREKNERLGYGDDKINWERKKYELQRRNLIFEQRRDKKLAEIKEMLIFADLI